MQKPLMPFLKKANRNFDPDDPMNSDLFVRVPHADDMERCFEVAKRVYETAEKEGIPLWPVLDIQEEDGITDVRLAVCHGVFGWDLTKPEFDLIAATVRNAAHAKGYETHRYFMPPRFKFRDREPSPRFNDLYHSRSVKS